MTQRNDPVQLTMRRVLLVALSGLVMFGIAGVWSAYRKERESAQLRIEAQTALADLTIQEGQLSGQIETLQSDRGREEALRDQYELGKKGEGLIIIVDPTQTQPAQATSTLLDRIKQALTWW